MDLVLLLQSGSGLLVILIILVFLLLWSSKSKKAAQAAKAKKNRVVPSSQREPTDLAHLKSIIKKRKSTNEELKKALDMVIKYHGTIHKKQGMNAHAEFDNYMDILFTICRHPHTSKELILGFDKALVKLNPSYKAEINDAITKGLNSRGV